MLRFHVLIHFHVLIYLPTTAGSSGRILQTYAMIYVSVMILNGTDQEL